MTAAVPASTFARHCRFSDAKFVWRDTWRAEDIDWSAHTSFTPLVMIEQEKCAGGTSRGVDEPANAARSASASPALTPADTESRSSETEARIERLFATGAACDFEDGTPSPFSAGLLAAVREHSTSAMEVVAHLIVYAKVNRRVASEALRWLGQMKDAATLAYRRWLLETSLASVSPIVRDGAVLGLSYLEDVHCLPFLAQAAEREPIAHLRRDMTELLRYVERINQREPDGEVPQENP